jgi:hypothetical protein
MLTGMKGLIDKMRPWSAWIERIGLASLLVIALAMRIPQATRSLDFDELFVIIRYVKDHPLLDVFRNFWLTNHIGYTALAHITYNLFGKSELAYRLPALFFGIAGIALFWYWTRRYFGRWAAFLVTTFLVFSPANFTWSTTARGYTALVFFAILSTVLYFQHLNNRDKKFPWALAVTNLLALAFHVFFSIVIVIQACHLFWVAYIDRKHAGSLSSCVRGWGALLLSIAAAAAIYLPLTYSIWSRLAGEHAKEPLMWKFPAVAFGILMAVPLLPAGFVMLPFVFAGAFWPFKSRLKHWRSYAGFLLASFFIVWLLRPNFLTPRFFAYLLPFVFLFISVAAVSLMKSFRGIYRGFAVALVAAAMVVLCWFWRVTPAWIVIDEMDPYREVVQEVERISDPSVRLCAFGDIHSDFFYQYYAKRPVVTISSFEEFQRFVAQGGSMACFHTNRIGPDGDNLKIFYILSQTSMRKRLGTIDVFFMNTSAPRP